MARSSQQIDKPFLLLTAGLLVFGLIILLSASAPLAHERFGDSFYYFKHQLTLGLLPGLIAMAVTYSIPYHFWRRNVLAFLVISLGLLLLVFIPSVGTDFGTFAKSWVTIGGISFQPSEIVKLTFLLYLAAWLERRVQNLGDVHTGLIPFVVILGTIAILMLMQPDLGTLSIIAAMAFILYFVAGGPLMFLLGLGGLGLGAFAIAIHASPYRAARFMTFLHPELDPQGIGYQINQALLAIGSGGLFGRGYGHSLQKFQYLPEVVGDSIFAVLAEEMGFVLSVAFLLAFLFLILRGLKIAENAPDAFAKFIVVGVMAWFGVQGFVNIGSMIGILPITGVPLPFLSYGGTALTVSLAATGLVLNVSKHAT